MIETKSGNSADIESDSSDEVEKTKESKAAKVIKMNRLSELKRKMFNKNSKSIQTEPVHVKKRVKTKSSSTTYEPLKVHTKNKKIIMFFI